MSPEFIDIAFRILILFFLFTGWRKGFVRTLIGPIALILGIFIGLYNYYSTEPEIVKSIKNISKLNKY